MMPQRLGIVALDQPRAGTHGRARRQEARREIRIAQEIGSRISDRIGEVGRDHEAARGKADRRLQHIGQRPGAVGC
jgi:hypothetical protein